MAVPTANDIAALSVPGTINYTVTSTVSQTVASLELSSTAKLSITGGTFTATGGTGSGANAGVIAIGNNTTFSVGGPLKNSGTIQLNSGGNTTELLLTASSTTLSGGGHLTIGDSAANVVTASAATDLLDNIDNIISGGGSLGAGSLAITNHSAGVINASAASTALVVNTGAAVLHNSGLIEATGAAGLTIAGTTVDGSQGGVVQAAGGTVRLQSASLAGGTLKSSGGATITTTDRGSLLSGVSATVNNQAAVVIANNTSLTIQGTINDTGSIKLDSGGNDTELVIGSVGATLTGNGQIILGDSNANTLTGVSATAKLTNVNNTIAGSGQLGAGNLMLVNQASGIINANNANAALVLNTGSSTVSNAGLIEATGAAGLTIVNTTVNDNAGGVISAAGGVVRLQSAHIIGGALTSSGSGEIDTVDRGSLLDAVSQAVTSSARINILNNTSLTVQGTLNSTGVLALSSGGNTTELIVGQPNLTLSGTGQVLLSDSSANYVIGTLSGAAGSQTVSVLTLNSTLSGAGQVGANLRLVNNATIDAIESARLLLSTGSTAVAGSNLVTNAGTLESTNPTNASAVGGLTILNTIIANGSAGLVLASGTASHVDLQSATIRAGTIETLGGGVIQTLDRGSLLDGAASAVKIVGAITISNNTSLHLQGAINNTGTLALASGGNATELLIDVNTTLTGGGRVTLSNSGANYLYGATAATTLTNVNNTIMGGGQLGNASLTLVNQSAGVINASSATDQLVINTAGHNLVNQGLIEATGAAGLTLINTTVDDSAAGRLMAAGAEIRLQNATVIGGTLGASGVGRYVTADRSSLLDGQTFAVTLQAPIHIANNTSLNIRGTIHNASSIFLDSGGNDTELVITGAGVTLDGAGHVTLSDNSQNYLLGATAATTLTNVDNVIAGGGQLGNGSLTLVNQAAGVINANANAALVLNTSGHTTLNTGLIEATGAGGLIIINTTVDDRNGGVLLASNSTITLSATTVIGGALTTSGTGHYVTAGRSSLLDASAATINVQGRIDVGNNTSINVQGAIRNTSTIALNSGGNDTELDITAAGATLTGGGAVVLSDNSQNYILGASSAATLTNVDNIISGGGNLGNGSLTLVNQAAGVINANGAAALVLNTSGAPTTNDGLIEATGSGGLLIQNTTVNGATDGTVLAAGSIVTLSGAVLAGGLLRSTLGGSFVTAGRASLLDGTAHVVDSNALFNIVNNTSLNLSGAIRNGGVIGLNSQGNDTEIVIAAGGATLTGGGQVTLSDNSQNYLLGASSSATLTNVDNTISGGGNLGYGSLNLVNQANGVINGSAGATLTLNTGANAITNAGLIEATGAGGVVITSAVINTGVLEANGGHLTLNGAVTGAGVANVVSGSIVFASTYSGDIHFTGATGLVELDHSTGYGGTIYGFSTSGGGTLDTLDLRDISFTGPGQTSYAGGVLTITDGIHTAHLHLSGDYSGTTFQTASDGSGGLNLTILSHAPAAAADSYSDPTNQTLSVNAASGVLRNDVDPNGQTLTAALASGGGPAHGALTLNADGSFIYTPTAGYAGTDSFRYVATDSVGSSNAATVTITVATNVPTLRPDAYSVATGQPLTISAAAGVLANDTDPNGQTLTASLAPGAGPQHGTLTLNANGSFTYAPTAGYVGADSFNYVAGDSQATGSPTKVTLTVGAGAPNSVADSYSASASTTLSVNAATGVLANDTDPNGRPLTAALAAGGSPIHGALTLNANGSFTYTPNAGFTGADSFIYIASDGVASGAQTTVTLTVGTGAPAAHADSYADNAGQSLSVNAAAGVLANDTDPNGLPLTAVLAAGGGPTHGTLTLNSDGSFLYNPTVGYAGPDSFTYIARDASASSAPTTVSLSVTGRAPTSLADSYSVAAGQSLTVNAATGVLANDTDRNGLALTAAVTTGGGPSHGTLSLNANGSLTYTPTAGYSGADSFTYIASDSLNAGPATTVSLTVTASPPVGHADGYAAHAGQTLTVAATAGVLANDSDPNGLPLTAALATGGAPAHGALTLNVDGSFSYTPTSGYAGQDSFQYLPRDSAANGAPMTVTITVSATPPTSHTDSYSAQQGQTLTVAAAAGVLANDTDANGLPLTAALAQGGAPAHGAVTLNSDGAFVYTPTAGYFGADAFVYQASDSLGAGSPTTVTVNVAAAAPVARPDSYATTAGHALSVAAATGVLANDSDPAGLALSAVLATGGGPAHGALSLNPNGGFLYTPTAGYVGADGFNYLATDSAGSSLVTHVSLAVTAAAPTTLADVYSVVAGQKLVVSAAVGVLANDLGLNGARLTATLSPTARPSHGVVTLAADGSFTYTPLVHQGGAYVGIDSFSYIASDGVSGAVATKVDIFNGGGHPVLNFTTGLDQLTGVAGGNVFALAKGQLADPAANGGLLDTVTNFSGANDFLVLRGFTSAATLTYEHDLSGAPNAHVYLITDGAYHGEIVLEFSDLTSPAPDHHWYGFI